jgi:hypothetical protein
MSDDARRPEDALLDRVTRELRRPVTLDADIEARVMLAIEAERSAPSHAPSLTRDLLSRGGAAWWVGGLAAVLALAAGIALRDARRGPPVPPSVVAGAPVAASAKPVRFQLVAPASSRVSIVGDFNDWDPQASPMARANERGPWSVRLSLPPGRYRYTFLVDGKRWVQDPSEPPALGNDFDTPTSVITITAGAI